MPTRSNTIFVCSIALLIFELIPVKGKSMLLVVNLKNIEIEEKVEEILKNAKVKFSVKSKNVFKEKADIMYEISTKDDTELLKSLSKLENVTALNLIKQD